MCKGTCLTEIIIADVALLQLVYKLTKEKRQAQSSLIFSEASRGSLFPTLYSPDSSSEYSEFCTTSPQAILISPSPSTPPRPLCLIFLPFPQMPCFSLPLCLCTFCFLYLDFPFLFSLAGKVLHIFLNQLFCYLFVKLLSSIPSPNPLFSPPPRPPSDRVSLILEHLGCRITLGRIHWCLEYLK